MPKYMLIIEMKDGENLFDIFNINDMIVDIGYDYDKDEGWSFIRKKLLNAKPINAYLNSIDLLDVMIRSLYDSRNIEEVDCRCNDLSRIITMLFIYCDIDMTEYREMIKLIMENANHARTILMHRDIAEVVDDD